MTRTFGVAGLVAVLLVSMLAAPAAAQPSTVGQWVSVPALPFFPVHVALLPTGGVMVWPGDQGISGNDPRLWDPATATTTPLTRPGYDTFCSGHTFLGDGRLFVAGGHIQNNVGLSNASAYDPITNTWTAFPAMNAGRWYPTTTTLANGDALVVSGSIDNTVGVNRLPQVLEVATGTWRNLTNAQLGLPLYPQMLLAPNGSIFNPGPSQTTRYLNTSGAGAWTVVGNRQFGDRSYGSAVMYDNGKVLVMGGGDPPTRTAEVIDLNAPSPTWRLVGRMAIARRQINAVLLPDGKVLVTGGTSGAGFNDASSPVFPAEMWDPTTETWTTMASAQIPRLYHSAGLLLPDGRVLTTGGNGFPETEVYSPPYLFKGARPTITTAPSTVTYGQSFFVGTPDGAGVSSVTLIRLGSVTHAFNQNQRISRLSFTQTTGGLNVVAPANANQAPVGHYMLFVLNGTGVPSVAKIVQLAPAGILPTVSIGDATVTEGNAGSVNATFTVSLSAASTQTVTVQYATANGTATAGTDYTATSGTVTFAPGVVTRPITVAVLGDTAIEATETFVVNLSNPANATIGDGQGVGTITNDDAPATPTVSIGDATVTEGNAGAVNAVFTVTLSAASTQTVTVQYATANGTATAGSDYTATSSTLTFTPGQVSTTVTVAVLGDTVVEPTETFVVNLSNPTNATIGDGQGVGTITNDDAPATPTMSIGDATVTEGNAGSVNAVFTVTLSAASTQTVTVQFATANGTATAGNDYTATSGTLTFTPGQVSTTITVAVLGDTVVEATETFAVNLSNPTNATIADGQGLGTIIDDEAPAGLVLAYGFEEGMGSSTADLSGNGHPGTLVGATWTTTGKYGKAVALDGSAQYVRVDAPNAPTGDFSWMVWANPTTLAGWLGLLEIQTSASTGVELALDAGRPQVWSNGQLRLTASSSLPVNAWSHLAITRAGSTLTVYVNGGSVGTATETAAFSWGTCPFLIGVDADSGCTGLLNGHFPGQLDEVRIYNRALSAGEIQSAMNTPLVSIPPTVSIGDATVTEGNTGSVSAVFTVTLSAASSQTVTVQYATANGTATAGSDYTATSGTLTFTPGQVSTTVTVAVLGDTVIEATETFAVNLSNPSNATIGDGQGLGTIIDNDTPPPTVSIGDATVTEGNAGAVNAVFTVSLSAASTQTVTVQFATANGTATAGSDYTATSGTLTFTPGQVSTTVTVAVLGDTVVEATETFVVNLSNPTNATIGDGQGVGAITNDDVPPPPTVSLGDAAVTEGNAGAVNAVFTVTLSAASTQTVTVQFATANGTATAGSDYTATSGTLTFTPGQVSTTVTVAVLGDTVFEPTETFVVNLSNPTNATIGDGQGVGTITNDDAPPPPTISIGDATVTEGNAGAVNAVFTVTLSAASTQTVTVQFATANGTATAGNDYTATSGTLTFTPGQVSTTITVAVLGDTVAEATETFAINLSNPTNATIADGQGLGTILDNEGLPGLVIAYGFEEGIGSTTADVSGNGHPGTLVGATWTTTGKYGKAVALDGSAQYVRVDAPNAPTGDFSWMVWANPTTLAGWLGLLEIQTSASTGVELALDAGRPQVWSNGGLRLTATSSLPVNTWSHLAITRAGSTLTVYVNGASVGTATETAAFSWAPCPFLIGVDADSGCTGLLNGNFPGQLDELRIYDRALSPSEIQNAMNTPLPTP